MENFLTLVADRITVSKVNFMCKINYSHKSLMASEIKKVHNQTYEEGLS